MDHEPLRGVHFLLVARKQQPEMAGCEKSHRLSKDFVTNFPAVITLAVLYCYDAIHYSTEPVTCILLCLKIVFTFSHLLCSPRH